MVSFSSMETASTKSNASDSALCVLGYKALPSTYPHIEWRYAWFPDWFFKIDRGFDKLVLPQANIRLEWILDWDHRRRTPLIPGWWEVYLKQHNERLDALRSRGVRAILSGECPAYKTNAAWYGAAALGTDANGNRFVWGHVKQTDNYGRTTLQTPVNEFGDYNTLKKLGDHLDDQIRAYYYDHGIWKDALDAIVEEARKQHNI